MDASLTLARQNWKDLSKSKPAPVSQWYLDNHGEPGRQVWHFDESGKRKQSFIERYLTGQDQPGSGTPTLLKDNPSLDEALDAAVNFMTQLQWSDGHWPNDYGGPMFLMPGLIFAHFISNTPISEQHKLQMIRYLSRWQRHDGGWGIHMEGDSTQFGTVMNYVALRLLGLPAEDPRCERARAYVRASGGAVTIPSWGKFWLATVGLFEWEGMNPLPPELYLLPYWFPVHPGRFWCHCRMVFLPMSFIYAGRPPPPDHPIVGELRSELFLEEYSRVDWIGARNRVAPQDLYTPHSLFADVAHMVFHAYEQLAPRWLRRKARDFVWKQIEFEDKSSNFVDIGPVNKVINFLATWYAQGSDSEHFKSHLNRIPDYLWLGVDGMKMQGYNGCQLWDTAFALQAMSETPLTKKYKDAISRGYSYIDNCQVITDCPELDPYFRHISKGAWPFSTRQHGWPISDCTAEGLRAELSLRPLDYIKPHLLPEERIFDAVNVLLSYQNFDGGFPTYELMRVSPMMEAFNVSEVFGDIIVDYSYVELTSAALRTLLRFQSFWPNHRTAEISEAVRRGIAYIKGKQTAAGGWYGSWAVCFSYATWFAVEGMILAGVPEDDPSIIAACRYLLELQRTDGSWSEDFRSCMDHVWVEGKEGQVVHTAWCCMALMRANSSPAAVHRGIQFLLRRQLKNGDWPREEIKGQFNATTGISYESYKNTFPMWALARYLKWPMRQAF